ncbi:MAG: hypothetical protein WCL70_05490 [Paludibacter sp.]
MKNIEDKLYPLLHAYKKSPQLIKNIIGGLYSTLPKKIMYGNTYLDFVRLIEQSKTFTKEEILNYQWTEIDKVLDIAFQTIPFYQKLYVEYGIKRFQIQNFDDFKNLPIITKSDIKTNSESMVSSIYTNDKLKMNTGGSTGAPLEFYIHKGITRPKEQAFLNMFFSSLGYDRKIKSVTFRGDKINGNTLYMYDPIKNTYIFSSYRISSLTINKIVESLNKIKPQFFFGYPSVIYELAQLIKLNADLRLNFNIKSIILASEKLFDFQISLIESVFNSKVSTYYGHSERLTLAYKCATCDNYLVDPIYGYMELVDTNNEIITDKNRTGRIISTGFNNAVMPLIRYETNDESCLTNEFCEHCNCEKYPLILNGIEGRTSDYIIGDDGRKISITAIIFGQHLTEFKKMSGFQLIQYISGKVDFNILGVNVLTFSEESSLKEKLQNCSDKTIEFEIKYVNELIKTSTGKFKYLIQNIK